MAATNQQTCAMTKIGKSPTYSVAADHRARAPRNRTLTLHESDLPSLRRRLLSVDEVRDGNHIGRTILGDCFQAVDRIPRNQIDLLILDPPYNLNKTFGGNRFSRRSDDEYTAWIANIIESLFPLLKPSSTVYICADWMSSTSVFKAASEFLKVRNRITWEREKGRGALSNWKNTSEDIWYCTVSERYTFNVHDVKMRRRVIAPYRDRDGKPKDWRETVAGNFRDTYPSNLWTDITIPFWSMAENTDHPAQKSEKLFAKLILASSNPGDIILDPFLGSGTSSVVAKKLARRFCGIEIEEEYAMLAEKRLSLAEIDNAIQGYEDHVFWERNTAHSGKRHGETAGRRARTDPELPFD